MGVGPNGELLDRDAETFWAGIKARVPTTEEAYVKHDRVMWVNILDENTCCAKVQIALPPPAPATETILYTDFLVLLREKSNGWRIISKVYSPGQIGSEAPWGKGDQARLGPKDLAAVTEAAWGGYLASGRAGSGEGMKKVFHPNARLTFVSQGDPQGGDLSIISSDEFCSRVDKRWEMDMHKKYAHLANDPRAAQADTLLGVDMAGPNVAMVTLKVGYPPFLYSDFLSFLKLKDGWWIAAKSSCNVPFLVEEAKEE